jgi:hypothetical protein
LYVVTPTRTIRKLLSFPLSLHVLAAVYSTSLSYDYSRVSAWEEEEEDHLLVDCNVISADKIAATVNAWDRHPNSFASIKVLEREGSRGSSVQNFILRQRNLKIPTVVGPSKLIPHKESM